MNVTLTSFVSGLITLLIPVGKFSFCSLVLPLSVEFAATPSEPARYNPAESCFLIKTSESGLYRTKLPPHPLHYILLYTAQCSGVSCSSLAAGECSLLYSGNTRLSFLSDTLTLMQDNKLTSTHSSLCLPPPSLLHIHTQCCCIINESLPSRYTSVSLQSGT